MSDQTDFGTNAIFSSASEDVAKALQLIRENGGDAEIAARFLTPGMAVMIVQNESLGRTWAERFPSQGQNQYGEAEVAYGFAQYDQRPVAVSLQPGGVLEGLNGMVKFENGVIAGTDPATGEERLIFDPSNPNGQAGSPGWLQNAAAKWDDKKIDKWRTRLSKMGYNVADKGGWAEDLRSGLYAYYRAFYLNRGNPVRQSPKEAVDDVTVRDIFHPAEVRGSVRDLYQERYNDDPTPEELQQDTEFVMQIAKKLLKKGVDPQRIASITGAKYEEAFNATPQAKLAQQEQDDLENQTQLRDGILSLGQLMA